MGWLNPNKILDKTIETPNNKSLPPHEIRNGKMQKYSVRLRGFQFLKGVAGKEGRPFLEGLQFLHNKQTKIWSI